MLQLLALLAVLDAQCLYQVLQGLAHLAAQDKLDPVQALQLEVPVLC